MVQFGVGVPSAILSGVKEFLSSDMDAFAALVLFVSVVFSMLKLIGLLTILGATHTGWAGRLRYRSSGCARPPR